MAGLNTGGGGGSGQSAGAIRAGAAFVELVARDKLSPVIDKLQRRFAGLGSALIKGGVAGVAAGGAVLAPIVGLVTSGVERLDRMAATADKLNIPVEEFSRLAHAAEVAGVEIDQLAANPQRYADLLAEAPATATEDIQAAVAASREWRKTMIALKDAAVPLAAAVLPMFRQFAQFVRDNAGFVQVIAKAGVALAALGAAGVVAGGAISAVGIAFGALKAVLLGGVVAVNAVIAAFAALRAVLLATVTLVPVLSAAWAALKAVVLGGLAGLVAVKAVFLALLSPIGLAAVAVGALGYALATQSEAGREFASGFQSAFAPLGPMFTDLGETFKKVWGGVLAALQKGDIEAALKVVTAGLKVSWFTLVEELTKRWDEFMRKLIGSRAQAVDLIGETIMAAEVGWIRILFGHDAAEKRARELMHEWNEMAAHESQQRNARSNPGLAAARAELAAARAELDEALRRANSPPQDRRPDMPSHGGDIPAQLVARVKGAFDGPLAQQFGIGDRWQRDQLAELRRLNVTQDAALKLLESATGIVWR